MDAEQLRSLQTPIKDRYKNSPADAIVKLHSEGRINVDKLHCAVTTPRGEIVAGLHPAAGGDGNGACSGDMLLDALVACAGVTFSAVATALQIPIRNATIHAHGEMDFRGTLGVSKEAPIGVTSIQLKFVVDSDATQEQLEKLVKLTERYCVVYQTLVTPPRVTAMIERAESSSS